MTISYPLSLPTNVSFADVQMTAMESVSISRSAFTFATQVQEFQGMMWSASVSLPEMERAYAEEWMCTLLSLRGQRGTFYLGDPLGKTPRGSASGTPLVNGGGQTGQTLNTKGWSVSSTGVLKKGDYIQIGSRLFKVLVDVNSDGSGNASGIDIWPRLRESPANNDPITTSSAKGLFRLDGSTNVIWSASSTKLFSIGFNAIEAI